MKTLSFFAKNNPLKARYILAFAHVLVWLIAIFLGVYLFLHDLPIPFWVGIVFAHLFFLAYFLYPYRDHKKGLFKYSYFRQKSHKIRIERIAASHQKEQKGEW